MASGELTTIVAAGFLATLAMTLVGYLLGAAGLTYFDLDVYLAMRLGRADWAPGLGVVVHFLVGIVLAAGYVLLWEPLLGAPPLLSGLLFGVALWLVGILLVLPLLAKQLPAQQRDRRALVALLVAHLVYGALLAGRSLTFAQP